MRKRIIISSLISIVTHLIINASANASEIYNKDGNRLDLYGKVDARHVFSDNKPEDGDETYIRMGFKGETKINDELDGYGQWEYNFNGNKSEGSDAQTGNATRLGLVGLTTKKYGSLEYGRSLGALYDTESYTDMMPIYGGNSWARNDNFMSKRSTGLITYRNQGLFDLVPNLGIAVQYQGKNERSDVTRSNGDGVAMSTQYSFNNGISISGSWGQSDRTDGQQADGQGGQASAWASAIKYDQNQIYLAAMYSETKNMTPYTNTLFASKTKNLELVTQYQFLNGLRPSVGFVISRGSNLAASGNSSETFTGGDENLLKYIEVGSNYYLNKNMVLYADYKINLLKDNVFTRTAGVSTSNSVGIGMVYQF
ncbi:porin [Ewingella sp. S1.OA.A_B6]